MLDFEVITKVLAALKIKDIETEIEYFIDFTKFFFKVKNLRGIPESNTAVIRIKTLVFER